MEKKYQKIVAYDLDCERDNEGNFRMDLSIILYLYTIMVISTSGKTQIRQPSRPGWFSKLSSEGAKY